MAHSPKAWAKARHLVVVAGEAYESAAQKSRIPLSTLKKRAAAERWQQDREASMSYLDIQRENKMLLAQHLQRQLREGQAPDPQAIFGLARLEAAIPEYRYQAEADTQAPDLEELLAADPLEQQRVILRGAASVVRGLARSELAVTLEELADAL